jgi:hypothetical protein
MPFGITLFQIEFAAVIDRRYSHTDKKIKRSLFVRVVFGDAMAKNQAIPAGLWPQERVLLKIFGRGMGRMTGYFIPMAKIPLASGFPPAGRRRGRPGGKNHSRLARRAGWSRSLNPIIEEGRSG